MADCLSLILSGSVIQGIVCPFTNVIGLWFFALILAVVELAIVIKYDNMLAPSVMGILAGIVMVNMVPPEMGIIPILILVANGAGILYSLFIRKD